MFIAIKYSNVDILKEILDHNPDKSSLYNGDTALHFAVRENKLKAALYLIGYDYSINSLNKNNETPIQLAQHLKYQQMLEQLESPVSRQKAADLKHVSTRDSRKVVLFRNLPPDQQPQSFKKFQQQQKPQQFQVPPETESQPVSNNSEMNFQQEPIFHDKNQFMDSNSNLTSDMNQFQNSQPLNLNQNQNLQQLNLNQNSQPLNLNQNQNLQQLNLNQNSQPLNMDQFQSLNLNQNMNQPINPAFPNGAFPSAINPPNIINQQYCYPNIMPQPQPIQVNNLVQREDFSQLQKRVIVIEQVLSQILPKYQNQSLFQPKICSACNSKPGLNICPVCGNSFCQEDFYAHVAKGCKH